MFTYKYSNNLSINQCNYKNISHITFKMHENFI